MEQAIAECLRGQGTAGIFVSTSGQESPAERILKELRHQPDIKYVRRRRDGERAEGKGRGRAWVYAGVKLKQPTS